MGEIPRADVRQEGSDHWLLSIQRKEPKHAGLEVTVLEGQRFWGKGATEKGVNIPWTFENKEKELSK